MEIQYMILLDLPFKSVQFVKDEYFWKKYCKKHGYEYVRSLRGRVVIKPPSKRHEHWAFCKICRVLWHVCELNK